MYIDNKIVPTLYYIINVLYCIIIHAVVDVVRKYYYYITIETVI